MRTQNRIFGLPNKCLPINQKTPMRNYGRMTRLFVLPLLFTFLVSLCQNNANAQQPSASPSPSVTRSQQETIERQQESISQLLDQLTDERKKRDAADAALKAAIEERNEARLTLAKANTALESADKAIATVQKAMEVSDRAIAQQQKAIESYDKAIEKAQTLIDRYETRLAKTEAALDKAQGRILKAGIFGFLVGIGKSLLGF